MRTPQASTGSVGSRGARGKTSPVPRRRGVAVLIVLLLLSITLGLSYAMVRSQTTALQIQQNANVRVSARRAALTGLTVGLKKMHTNAWCYGDGVNTTLAGSIGDSLIYQVSYAAGDPSLAADDPDYPYRVTILSTGTATDPTDPERTSTHQARAVVQLVPRALAEEPDDWDTMQQYTVYQSKKDNFEIDIPCRLENQVRVQGKLKIAPHYPSDGNPWRRYLGDLNTMRLAGYPDYRPFNGPVALPVSEQDGEDLSALIVRLAVTTVNMPVKEAASDWTQPGSFTDYQVYPGGPVYTAPWVGSTLHNTVLEPDATTNPLGLFYRDGDISIWENVTVRGSLFCDHDVRIEGANVNFLPVELPALVGSEGSLRLPAVTCDKFVVKPGAGGSLTGLAAVFDTFEIERSPATLQFAFIGRAILKKLYVKEREPWQDENWDDRYEEFKAQLGGEGPVVPYFPLWMGMRGYDPRPRITFKPDPGPVTYHWKKTSDPIYVPHPDDSGLRWDLVEWTDSP